MTNAQAEHAQQLKEQEQRFRAALDDSLTSNENLLKDLKQAKDFGIALEAKCTALQSQSVQNSSQIQQLTGDLVLWKEKAIKADSLQLELEMAKRKVYFFRLIC